MGIWATPWSGHCSPGGNTCAANGFGSAPRQPGQFTYVHVTLLPDPAMTRSLLVEAGCCPGAGGVHAESVRGTATGRNRPEADIQRGR
jgi:hypothetical protein